MILMKAYYSCQCRTSEQIPITKHALLSIRVPPERNWSQSLKWVLYKKYWLVENFQGRKLTQMDEKYNYWGWQEKFSLSEENFSPTHIWGYWAGWLLSGCCSSVAVYWQLKLRGCPVLGDCFFSLQFPLCHIIPSRLFTMYSKQQHISKRQK